MGNISGSDELVTKQDLKAFYQAILPYLSNGSGGTTYTAGDGIDITNDTISTKKSTLNDMDEIVDTLPTGSSITTVSGYTPLGTIISYYGETAPRFYLACDGSEYNKADYPELANHLLSLTNHSQYEVSGDDTKFKVPDLRGEFLRGTGTNSHSMGGVGESVGVHQAPTQIPYNGNDGTSLVQSPRSLNIDYDTMAGSYKYMWIGAGGNNATGGHYLTTRPTNTSVLYCIAYKDIYTDPMNDYSTDEKIVGTWIDNKPIYQKTIYNNGNFLTFPINVQTLSIEKLINAHAMGRNTDSANQWCSAYINAAGGDLYLGSNQTELAWVSHGNTLGIIDVTIQYTKTTD